MAESIKQLPPGFVVKRSSAPPPGFVVQPKQPQEPAEPVETAPTTADVFGLEEGITNRGVLAPVGVDVKGNTVLTPSEMMLDIMDAVTLPGRVMQGHTPTQREILNFTATTVGGAPRGMGFAKRVPGSQRAGVRALKSKNATRAAGTSIDDVADDLARAAGDSTDDVAARRARFEEQGIPATRGDVTQDFAQQATESRLVSMAGGADGEPLRQMRLQQSDAFVGQVNKLVDTLGVPENTGQRIKDALGGRIKLLVKEKNALYKQIEQMSPDAANTPILTDDIVKQIPTGPAAKRAARNTPSDYKSLDGILVEFGIKTDDEAVSAFIKEGGEITPLRLGNMEEFRVALNDVYGDAPKSIRRLITPIKNALDGEVDIIAKSLEDVGATDANVAKVLKEARARWRTLKTEFSPQSVAGRLTGFKRDGVTPIVEASKVSSELLRPTAPIENLQRTLTSLRNAGKKGKLAIGDLQSSVIMDALESGLKAPSRKTSGIETVGGNQFAKALDKFGDDKLALLFRDNKEALKALNGLKQTALDISPAAAAVPRGSAPVLLELFNKVSNVPGLTKIADVVRLVKDAGADERAVRKALDSASPAVKQTVQTINRRYPSFAANLGLLTALNAENIIAPGDEDAFKALLNLEDGGA